jgi:hypothetical protein
MEAHLPPEGVDDANRARCHSLGPQV